jgi:major membrane immunogen (membrane-anchored lipoprotein)
MKYSLILLIIAFMFLEACGKKSYEDTTIHEQVFGKEPQYQEKIENIIHKKK